MGRNRSHDDYHPYCHHLLQVMVMDKVVKTYETRPNPQKVLNDAISKFQNKKVTHAHLLLWNNEKVPSLETLDMFSKFCGYKDWKDFCDKEFNPMFSHYKSSEFLEDVLPATKEDSNLYQASYSRYLRASENLKHDKFYTEIQSLIDKKIDLSNNVLASKEDLMRLIRMVNLSLFSQNKLDTYTVLNIIFTNLTNGIDLFEHLPIPKIYSQYAKILLGKMDFKNTPNQDGIPLKVWLDYLKTRSSFDRDVLALETLCFNSVPNHTDDKYTELIDFCSSLQIFIKKEDIVNNRLFHRFNAASLLKSK